MPQAFLIMQIGNAELDHVAASAIVPALVTCGLEPKRVDKHNKGGLQKTEIIEFIETSDIIIADLTNERPNCYLEIGYAPEAAAGAPILADMQPLDSSWAGYFRKLYRPG